jgi:PKHD-type hydroxylase
MLLHIPDVLTKDELASIRARLEEADWMDGRATSGVQAASVKSNEQVDQLSPIGRELSERVMDAVGRSPLFVSAALPQRIWPPHFTRYSNGNTFGNHIDASIMGRAGNAYRIRSDVSCTLFLAEPDEYEGGELTVEDTYGDHEVKLPAGDMVVYSSTSLHHVKPVTAGMRVASHFWVQSMVRSTEDRALLFQLDQTIQGIFAERGVLDPTYVSLTGIYHNLIRKWADA